MSTAPGHGIPAPGSPAAGTLFIVSAPSGAGKSTLVNALLAREPGIAALLLSITPGLDARAVHDLLLKSSKVSHGALQVNAASAVIALRSTEHASP